MFYGPHDAPRDYDQRIDHYSVLRTVEDISGLNHLSAAANAMTIRGDWK